LRNKRVYFAAPAALLLAACGEPAKVESAGAAPPAGGTTTAATVAAAAEQWPALYEVTGTVRARKSATISTKWMGYVRELRVGVGDRVEAGQLLVVLDARDLDATAARARAGRDEARSAIPEADSAVAAAAANLELAQTTFRRMSELYAKKSISDQEFDEASAKRKAAEAAHAMAKAKRAQLDSRIAQAEQESRSAEVARSYAEVTAPFAGIVTAKTVEAGNLASPGAPLLTIEGGGLRLEAAVEASRTMRTGQAATVTLEGVARTIAAKVAEVAPSVDAASRSYTVKLDLPADAAIRPGMFGRASFAVGERSVVAIPAAAVRAQGQLQSVNVVENGVARPRLITTGARSGDRVEVLSGLSQGERIEVRP
jgi:RND family efflux transporter MFP subunit